MSEILEVPNQWRAGVITNKGLGLLSKLITGNTLAITRAETGAGWVAEELLPQQTAVTDPKQALTFSAVSYPEEGKCMIPCKLTNEAVNTSYIARQIGLYADDPDEGEILFYITQVEDEDGGTGIPAANIIPSYSATWNLVIYYGMADGVDVTVDPAGAVTQEEMEAYVGDAFEPYTIEEIIAAFGTYEGGDSSGGTGVYTLDHNALYNRDLDDQHPISAIDGLDEALEDVNTDLEEVQAKVEDLQDNIGGETLNETEIDELWNEVMGEEA